MLIVLQCITFLAQANQINDTLAIYKVVYHSLTSKKKTRYNIKPKTYMVRNFDFKNMVNPFDKKSEEIWNRANWREFNLQMDTSKVKNYKLETNGKPWFPTTKSTYDYNLSFSPIIFNTKKDLALTVTTAYLNSENWKVVYYLEFVKGKGWGIINIFQFSMT